MAVSALGYTPFYVGVVVALAFGWRLRQGLGVAVALLLAGFLAQSMKTAFALPRPSDVDERVMEVPEWQPEALVARGGAPGFWELPTREAIAAVRERPDSSYGFPSGHVATSTANSFRLTTFPQGTCVTVSSSFTTSHRQGVASPSTSEHS